MMMALLRNGREKNHRAHRDRVPGEWTLTRCNLTYAVIADERERRETQPGTNKGGEKKPNVAYNSAV